MEGSSMIKLVHIPSELEDNISLDIETLSTRTNAAVVEVGVVKFKKNATTLTITDAAIYNIPVRLYINQEFYHIAHSTIAWWHTGSGRDLYNLPGTLSNLSLREHMGQLANLLHARFEGTNYFTRGMFDLPILANLLPSYNPLAKDFRCHHDVRTLHSIPKVKRLTPKPLNSHNALVDAMHNIEIIAAAYELEIRYEQECRYLANLCLRTTSAQ
jgi:hypothetical protein